MQGLRFESGHEHHTLPSACAFVSAVLHSAHKGRGRHLELRPLRRVRSSALLAELQQARVARLGRRQPRALEPYCTHHLRAAARHSASARPYLSFLKGSEIPYSPK